EAASKKAEARRRAEPEKAPPPQVAAKPDPSEALRALFSGASVYAQTRRRHPVRYDVWQFRPDGALSGAYTQSNNNPTLPDFTGSDRGRWWAEGGRVCVQWTSWDEGAARCYAISGTAPDYVASGGGGLLEGRFELRK
ncbi:MAG: hypothetical protein ACREH3_04610, partial [Geminicoccales bacterium]